MAEVTQGQPTEGNVATATPPVAPAGEPQVTPTPPISAEPKFAFGEDERKAMREVHRLARSNAALQERLKQRDAELAETRKRPGEPPAPRGAEVRPDEEGLADYYGTRISPEAAQRLQSLEASLQEERREREALRQEVKGLTEADTQAEAQENAAEMTRNLRAVVPAAVKTLMPGLAPEAQTEAEKDAWGYFTEAWDERAAVPGSDFPTEDEVQTMFSGAVGQVREKMRRYGLAQLAANRTAAAGQPPALGGTPSETAPKAYKDMTPEERERAKEEQLASVIRQHVKFSE